MVINQPLFRAGYESRNFSFEAYGTTSRDAFDALVDGLQRHAVQYDLPSDWFDIDSISVNAITITIGKATRDGAIIKG